MLKKVLSSILFFSCSIFGQTVGFLFYTFVGSFVINETIILRSMDVAVQYACWFHSLIQRQNSHHAEISRLICRANQFWLRYYGNSGF